MRSGRLAISFLTVLLCVGRAQGGGDASPYLAKRLAMVRDQIEREGISDPRVLEAMREVPRHLLVPPEYRSMAYEPRPLPIGEGQTISQPYVVAFMTEILRLKPGDRVLEVGTGSGYQAAIAAEIAGEDKAKEIQLLMEYNPAPPFDSGHPSTADAKTVEAIRKERAALQTKRTEQARRVAALYCD